MIKVVSNINRISPNISILYKILSIFENYDCCEEKGHKKFVPENFHRCDKQQIGRVHKEASNFRINRWVI